MRPTASSSNRHAAGNQSFHDRGQNRESGRGRPGRLGRLDRALGRRSGSEVTPYAADELGDGETTGSGPCA